MRQLNRLNARKVQTEKKPGRHADGGGLYLVVTEAGSRRWVFLYRRGVTKGGGRALREMGLGSARDVSLLRARELASEFRKALAEGRDPIADKRSSRDVLTFAQCATRYIEANKPGWRNQKHILQWSSTLDTYANPVIGRLPVSAIDVGHVCRVLEPIWITRTETASRLRGRIESILDWAAARNFRTGENPARWRGHLDKILPKPSKVQKVQHHPALPYAEIGPFMAKLRKRTGNAAGALEFLILTAARSAEVTRAHRCEINLVEKAWTVPGDRMKAGIEHRVPLSSRALTILKPVMEREGEPSDFLFPGDRPKKGLSHSAMLALLRRMTRDDLTAHGFRSTFKDWASETTNFPTEVVEMALAHTIKDKTEKAYRRGALFEKRRALMSAWAGYCESVGKGNVVPMSKTKAI